MTLIEVLISAVLLGVAVLALARIHTYSIQGLQQSNAMTQAMALAGQHLEMLAIQASSEGGVPAPCLRAASNLEDESCLAGGRALAPETDCTSWWLGSDTPAPDNPGELGNTDGNSSDGFGYRVDLFIANHPEPASYPEAMVAKVSVCWLSTSGDAHEINARRILVPGT